MGRKELSSNSSKIFFAFKISESMFTKVLLPAPILPSMAMNLYGVSKIKKCENELMDANYLYNFSTFAFLFPQFNFAK